MWHIEDKFRIRLGGNYYINCERLVMYKGKPLFNITRRDSDGLIGIDFDIYDKSRAKVATVRHGNIVSGNANAYDISFGPHHYMVSEKSTSRCICDIKRKDAVAGATVELDVFVELYTADGFLFLATPNQTNFGGMTMRNCTIENCGTGIAIN